MRDDASYRRQEEAPTASVPQRRQREVEEVREEQIDVEEEIRAKYEGKKRTNETRTALDAVKARVIAVAKQAVIPSACEVDFLADALAATEGASQRFASWRFSS